MASSIQRLSGTVNLQKTAECADAAAGVANAVLALALKPGDDWSVVISDANIVIVYPSWLDKVSLQSITFCEPDANGNPVQGVRQVPCTDFVPNS